jgi:hypothetical protein
LLGCFSPKFVSWIQDEIEGITVGQRAIVIPLQMLKLAFGGRRLGKKSVSVVVAQDDPANTDSDFMVVIPQRHAEADYGDKRWQKCHPPSASLKGGDKRQTEDARGQ